jgi:hypothetical protein
MPFWKRIATNPEDNRPLLTSLDADRRTTAPSEIDYDSVTVTAARAQIAEGQRSAREKRQNALYDDGTNRR